MHCTSEPCEHVFGNTRQSDREFTCSDFSNQVDKQNRRIDLTFKSDLKVSKEDGLSGYQETYSDFLNASKTEESCNGPCQVNDAKNIPMSMQLWPYVKTCLHSCSDKLGRLFDLLEVQNPDRCVFMTKAYSITTLLKQLISTAPRKFSYNNISGSSEENAIEADKDTEEDDKVDDDKNKEDITIKKLEEFAKDMTSDGDTIDEVNMKNIARDENEVSNNDYKEVIDIDDNNNEPEILVNSCEENRNIKKEEKKKEKYEKINERNRDVMKKTIATLDCDMLKELPELAIAGIASLDNIERGSLSEKTKAKSFLGRWFEKTKELKETKDMDVELKDKEKVELHVERDRIISSSFEVKNANNNEDKDKAKDKKIIIHKYRVLSVYTKKYNKWFMTEEKQPWSPFMTKDELKQHRCAVRMVVDGAFDGYDDVDLNSSESPRKHICKIITGLEIGCVHNEFYNY